jgi:hypothetical protein
VYVNDRLKAKMETPVKSNELTHKGEKAPLDFLARARGGILLVIVAICLLSEFRLVKQAGRLHPSLWGREPQSLYDKRFDDVRKLLPKRGVVGYLSDSPGNVGNYYFTQYALAPLVVDNSTDHHYVIGNFGDPHSPISINHDWVLLRDFGNGVVLFENRTR